MKVHVPEREDEGVGMMVEGEQQDIVLVTILSGTVHNSIRMEEPQDQRREPNCETC